MANTLAAGLGPRGNFVEVSCVPDSTFETALDALVAAGTKVIGKLVEWTYAANYQVTLPSTNEHPDGMIIAYKKTASGSASSYLLTCRMWSYKADDGTRQPLTQIQTFDYDSNCTIALKDNIKVYGSDYRLVTDAASSGWGCVIALQSNDKCDVLL